MGYYLAIKKNVILLFGTAWMDPEGIMVNVIVDQRKTNTTYFYLYMGSIKKTNKLNLVILFIIINNI